MPVKKPSQPKYNPYINYSKPFQEISKSLEGLKKYIPKEKLKTVKSSIYTLIAKAINAADKASVRPARLKNKVSSMASAAKTKAYEKLKPHTDKINISKSFESFLNNLDNKYDKKKWYKFFAELLGSPRIRKGTDDEMKMRYNRTSNKD